VAFGNGQLPPENARESYVQEGLLAIRRCVLETSQLSFSYMLKKGMLVQDVLELEKNS
jgi:hypothetical protein